MSEPIVAIGLGNPILTDDGAGLALARMLEEAGLTGVTIKYAHSGGLDLMELMVGHEHAIILDALEAEDSSDIAYGSLCEVTNSELAGTRNACSSHSSTLGEALMAARALGLEVPEPECIRLYGIRAKDVITVSETLTAEVASALPLSLKEICGVIESIQKASPAHA